MNVHNILSRDNTPMCEIFLHVCQRAKTILPRHKFTLKIKFWYWGQDHTEDMNVRNTSIWCQNDMAPSIDKKSVARTQCHVENFKFDLDWLIGRLNDWFIGFYAVSAIFDLEVKCQRNIGITNERDTILMVMHVQPYARYVYQCQRGWSVQSFVFCFVWGWSVQSFVFCLGLGMECPVLPADGNTVTKTREVRRAIASGENV